MKHEIINLDANWMRILIFGFVVCSSLLAVVRCKEETVIEPPKAPKIVAVTPTLGTVGADVVIRGENFGTSVEANEVAINNKIIEILSASAIEIKIRIPKGLGSGEVTITANAMKARGPVFTYYDDVIVSSVEPLSGPFDTVITIKGENFEDEPNLNQVTLNGKKLPIISSSTTELKVSIPKATGSGKIVVMTQYSMFEGPAFEYVVVPVVYTIAGSGQAGFANGVGEAAQFDNPDGLAVDAEDNIYVCDRGNNRIRKIDKEGNVTTLAGSGVQGIQDGNLQTASFHSPSGIVTKQGEFLITDSGSGNIRKINSSGRVITIAGDGTPGFTDGIGTTARFGSPRGIAMDTDGNLWVVDHGNSVIRKISIAAVVTTFAGDGIHGFADGSGSGARFNFPLGVAIGMNNDMFIADHLNDRVRKMNFSGNVETYAGVGKGYLDGNVVESKFSGPSCLAFDLAGNIIVGDGLNYRIRKLSKDGTVSTIAGDGIKGFKNGLGSEAQFEFINAIVVNSKGEIIVSDGGNHAIRRIVFE